MTLLGDVIVEYLKDKHPRWLVFESFEGLLLYKADSYAYQILIDTDALVILDNHCRNIKRKYTHANVLQLISEAIEEQSLSLSCDF